MRHLEIKALWLQQELKKKNFELVKIAGTVNPADGGTKALQGASYFEHRQVVGVEHIVRPSPKLLGFVGMITEHPQAKMRW